MKKKRVTDSWSFFLDHRLDHTAQFRLAIGSYVEQYSNAIQIVYKDHATGSEDPQLYEALKIDHPYPCTKVMWTPDRSHGSKDLLATTGDYLRIWSLSTGVNGVLRHKKEALLDNNKNSEYCAPLTSFDWNETDPNILGTSSIDTTCTIWNIHVNAI